MKYPQDYGSLSQGTEYGKCLSLLNESKLKGSKAINFEGYRLLSGMHDKKSFFKQNYQNLLFIFKALKNILTLQNSSEKRKKEKYFGDFFMLKMLKAGLSVASIFLNTIRYSIYYRKNV